ncbi:glycosyl hydrolase family 6 protein [Plasmopara halstedii]|uniref:Glycosyl hydrolase family 6 protein n=1 Tax=Plasmopara halstedii TaxID=4781 RepID=A0A0P1AZD5_PLAHL|nr:glycosyl hydrolase family 6 protein [Plasmopara halstedii]CEG46932.1 glycosyl hydrolase family 6 protein [Plasmopara halstedii]|eukprot:XP_024583301.1 glycosyl hydrolase family 6 protein [Plasmopara halstedii]
MVKILHSAVILASLALGFPVIESVGEELCSMVPLSFEPAKTKYPELAFAIDAVEEYSIAAWYTDRQTEAEKKTMLERLVKNCPEDSRLTVVVYGIPNKDCSGGFSNAGSVKNTADYKKFLTQLTTAVGTRKVLYVVEPDSVGLLAEKDGCGAEAGYEENLEVAVGILSKNPNAELYVDVGYWIVDSPDKLVVVVSVIKKLSLSGKVKGIVLNTSNYRSNKQISELCAKFQKAIGSTDMHCIADTSRNYLEPTSTDWCNVLPAGMGIPPTSETEIANLDYFMWIKVPGESDGTCNGGPDAGLFFDEAFKTLWDEGYLVKELGMNTIAQGGSGGSAGKGKSDYSPEQNTVAGEGDDEDTPAETPSSETMTKTGNTPDDPDDAYFTPSEAPEVTPAAPVMNCKVKRRVRH